jgi:glycerophosphoryl diester phosphodiesterase
MLHRMAPAVAAAAVLGALIPGTTSGASPLNCDQSPEPDRWEDAGEPDRGLENMVIAAHRGAAELAPENTLDAYRYAIAYGVEMIEVDVQQTLDGRYVSFHDTTVDAKTDGSGNIALMTYEEVRALNAAANEKWAGSEYDPAQIPSLEEVLDLARATGTGIYFDIKESVTNPVGVADTAEAYGLVENSAFLTYEPARAALIRAAHLDAPIMLSNPDPRIPPEMLYAIGQDYRWFGSSLPNYSPEKVAAVHDACGLVIPNVYQGDVTGSEAGDLLHARSIGADGAQVNNPDVVAEALEEPVLTRIEVDADGSRACLLDEEHGFGLPLKQLTVQGVTIGTRRGGCAVLPEDFVAGAIRFEGDGSALPSRTTHTP